MELDQFKRHYLKCCLPTDVTVYLHFLFSGHFATQLHKVGGELKSAEGQAWEHIMADIKTIIHHQSSRDGGDSNSSSSIFIVHKQVLRKLLMSCNNGGQPIELNDWLYTQVAEGMIVVRKERQERQNARKRKSREKQRTANITAAALLADDAVVDNASIVVEEDEEEEAVAGIEQETGRDALNQ
jgi:hypothetical protein